MDLYTEHAVRAAVAAFGNAEGATSYLDGAFVVVDKAVLCLFTTMPSGSVTLDSPIDVTWSSPPDPRSADCSSGGWPPAVVDVYDRSGPRVVRIRQHQVFLRGARGSTTRT
jgi:hypothetical protein